MTEKYMGPDWALDQDQRDPLKEFRSRFAIPKMNDSKPAVYLTGNSLGLMPVHAPQYIQAECEAWATHGVEGHVQGERPWVSYHELVSESLARVVGAKAHEVVAMNTLTANLHFMMSSFYRPRGKRRKILMLAHEFPSDLYASRSQIELHGGTDDDLVLVEPDPEGLLISDDEIINQITAVGEQLALVLIGNVNYLSGQAFNMSRITQAGHGVGASVGFDLAHGAGNLDCQLSTTGCDFAVWCHYKYMNSGPGAIAGAFVNERFGPDYNGPRLTGWWGHDKDTRFQMPRNFKAIPFVEGWQLSNPPIFQLAALRASLDIFDQVTMASLREKSRLLTDYMAARIEGELAKAWRIITPCDPSSRGCQLSLFYKGDAEAQDIQRKLLRHGVFVDYRKPGILRAAPTPIYNSFDDVDRFIEALKKCSN